MVKLSKSGYFQGILQIRNKKNAKFQDVLTLVIGDIERNEPITVAKIVEMKSGVDFYLSSNKYVHCLGRKIHGEFGGDFVVSKKLYTKDHQSGKNLYRVTVLVRLPDYNVGDIVEITGRLMLVRKIIGNRLICVDIVSGKRINLRSSKPDRIFPASIFLRARVVKTKPHLEVLHPKNFQSTVVENPSRIKGEFITVCEIDNKLYFIP